MMKICRKCNIEQPLGAFYTRRHGTCKSCIGIARKAARASNPEKEREYQRAYYKRNRPREQAWRNVQHLKTAYDLTLEEFQTMELAQGGLCAICKQPPSSGRYKKLCVDHDHKTAKVRGLLCYNCNMGLGYFHDNSIALEAAVAYLGKR